MNLYSLVSLIGGEVTPTVDSALTQGMSQIANQMTTTVINILPQIFTVIGIVMVTSFAIRFFRNNTRQTR